MTSPLIERVARAIEVAGSRVLSGENRQRHQERMARAAIKAMREPSEEMIRVGRRLEDRPGHVWRVMINAALEEDK